MNEIIEASRGAALPSPRVPISIRVGTMEDVPAIDALQKQYNKQLGFFPRAQMEGYIKGGWMMVAEERHEGEESASASCIPSVPSCLGASVPSIVGYCASRDRYLKRDELGAIFQLCVAPASQRRFVGMALLKHVFENAPYGCKLFCCWCAQDIEANRFWESMGFVPLAFRAGSAKKSRVHIFWQKRIRAGDETTPYWFPSQTGGGSIREDRLVLPIPPGMRWSDQMPRILPVARVSNPCLAAPRKKTMGCKPVVQKDTTPYAISRSKLHFATPKPVKEKPVRAKREKHKNDPKLVAAARELRDRWIERVNEDPSMLQGGSQGKYEMSRLIAGSAEAPPDSPRGLLEAA